MRKLKLVIAISWALIIIIACLMPSKTVSGFQVPLLSYDKLIHAGIYYLLTILWFLYFKPEAKTIKNGYLKICFFVFCYGVFIEVLQGSITKDRFADFNDALANGFGVLLALITYKLYIKIKTN